VGRSQGRTEQLINASPARVWSILEDSSLLPKWVPVVDEVVRHEEREGPGTVRRCNVDFGGRRGYMVERCVEAIPERRLRHVVADDSLGFTRHFADYAFVLELEPERPGRTLITCETFYEPRGVLSRMMNALVMRRKFAATRERILLGLKQISEEAPRGPN
jgi:uncharacterized protein YndB with AHSA1/START domain